MASKEDDKTGLWAITGKVLTTISVIIGIGVGGSTLYSKFFSTNSQLEMLVDLQKTLLPPSVVFQLKTLRQDLQWRGLDTLINAQAEKTTFTSPADERLFASKLDKALRERQENLWSKDLQISTPDYASIVFARIVNNGDIDATNISIDFPYPGEAEVTDPDNGKRVVTMPAVIKIAALRPSKECLVSVWVDSLYPLGLRSDKSILISSSTGLGKVHYTEAFRMNTSIYYPSYEFLPFYIFGGGCAIIAFVCFFLSLRQRISRQGIILGMDTISNVGPQNVVAEGSPSSSEAQIEGGTVPPKLLNAQTEAASER